MTSEEAMAAAMQRLQGTKDSRGPVGMMARGKTIYNSTSNAAQSGPGGPDMGRPPGPQMPQAPVQAPTAVPPAAMQAVLQKTGMQQQAPQAPMTPQSRPSSLPQAEAAIAKSNQAVSKLAQASMQAAAKRKVAKGISRSL